MAFASRAAPGCGTLGAVTKDEALALCKARAAEEGTAAGQWVPVPDGEDGWQVARVPLPPRTEPTVATEGDDSGRALANDPRPAHQRNVPGAWG